MKAIYVAAGALLMLALVACGSSSAPGTTTSTVGTATTADGGISPSTEAPTTETTSAAKSDGLAFGDTGEWKDITIALEGPSDGGPSEWEDGNKLVYFMATMTNGSDEPFDYNGLAFTMFDAEHYQYDSAFDSVDVPDFSTGTLAPGETVKGAVVFSMPSAAVPMGVKWQPDIMTSPKLTWGTP